MQILDFYLLGFRRLMAHVRASHRHCTFALWSQQLLSELSWVLLMLERVIVPSHLS